MIKAIVSTLFLLVLYGIGVYIREKRQAENNVKRKKEKTPKTYDVRCGRGLRLLGIFLFCIFSLVFIVNVGNVLWHWGIGTGSSIGTIMIFGILELLGIYIFSFTCIWKISVNGEEFI